jgi:hypothetical protein
MQPAAALHGGGGGGGGGGGARSHSSHAQYSPHSSHLALAPLTRAEVVAAFDVMTALEVGLCTLNQVDP